MEIRSYRIEISGIVQGVGFRPFVYRLATSMKIKGYVRNVGDRVEIIIECDFFTKEEFLKALKEEAPQISEIRDITEAPCEYQGFGDFAIVKSDVGTKPKVLVSPDISICDDCRHELLESSDFRYRYPFINCTNCGPRFTIIKDIPYDRANTTMAEFRMCDKCSEDYENPLDRRYHAQPVACEKCGPKLKFIVPGNPGLTSFSENALNDACQMLAEGKIVAIKSLGGYHLACSAMDDEAVRRLRDRKGRDAKPFAVMFDNIETIKTNCNINEAEENLLTSAKSPIVPVKKSNGYSLSGSVSFENSYVGAMLTYTPLHVMLFKKLEEMGTGLKALVMTSGNLSDEPICYKDDEAFERLEDIVDAFLTNDREIETRTDDSVVLIFRDREYPIRRARGYAPSPIKCKKTLRQNDGKLPTVLACGGEQKNTFCLNNDNEFFVSHHIGDIENTATLKSFATGILHYSKLFNLDVDIIAHDMHPDYFSTIFAKEAGAANGKVFAIQHHQAHIASCMADNDIDGDVIGVAFDGAGYGIDGAVWGGEFFSGNCREFKREGHFEYVMMPGGEAASRQPWRMAESYLYEIGSNVGDDLFFYVSDEERRVVRQMLEKGINSPLTSSAGRLFDAVSALTGFTGRISFEGHAAAELQHLAEKVSRDVSDEDKYRFHFSKEEGRFTVCFDNMIKGIIDDVGFNISRERIAAKFHNTLAHAIAAGVEEVRHRTGLNRVALSGGVFQNVLLLEKSLRLLEKRNFQTFIHHRVPANDGGLSLGQAVMALKQL